MTKLPTESAIITFLPILFGMFACFLPDAKYMLQGTGFTTKIADDYSGWITIFLLLLFSAYSFIRQRKRAHIPKAADLIMGFYLLGFALFKGYQTLTLYAGVDEGSLARVMDASAKIREGLILLALAGIWLTIRGLKRRPV